MRRLSMQKKHIKTAVCSVGICIILSILFTGCAANRATNTELNTEINLEDFVSSGYREYADPADLENFDPDNFMGKNLDLLTEEEKERLNELMAEENRKTDEARMKKYKHCYGDSDNYALVDPMDRTEAVRAHGEFIDPEKAFEQSLIDYQDAYEHVGRQFNLRVPKKDDLDAIREFAHFCSQATSEDHELWIKCSDLGALLRTYRRGYV